jgi:hypothetical protein
VTEQGLSDEVKKFIIEQIDSLEQLEILLLLHRRQDKEWTAQEVSRELRLSQISVATRLADLQKQGLLIVREASDPLYQYAPQKPTIAPIVDSLVKLYPDYRFTVINLIFSKPLDKIKTFADAFKLKKDKDNG